MGYMPREERDSIQSSWPSCWTAFSIRSRVFPSRAWRTARQTRAREIDARIAPSEAVYVALRLLHGGIVGAGEYIVIAGERVNGIVTADLLKRPEVHAEQVAPSSPVLGRLSRDDRRVVAETIAGGLPYPAH